MDEKIVSVDEALRLAIAEAEKGAPFVSPNPLVGCVIVSESGHVIAKGHHAKYGGPHAEVDALRDLTEAQLKGATVYVTLEPCAHEGKTPSCAKALAKLPIKKVIYGLQDPNPLVSGEGAQILRSAGIEAVEYQGALKVNLENLCEVFLKNFREKKIFVAAKVASSLDGQIALKTGESKWITGPESREKAHELRARYDAILVGRKTIEVDDPSLNIRHPHIQKETTLIVLDPSSNLVKEIKSGRSFRFLKTHAVEKIYFAVHEKDPVFPYQQIDFRSLPELHQKLWDIHLRSIFVEGGATTYSRYFQDGLVDRLHLFMAPSMIGAARGLSWTKDLSIATLSEKIQLHDPEIQMLAGDIYVTSRFSKTVSSGPKV